MKAPNQARLCLFAGLICQLLSPLQAEARTSKNPPFRIGFIYPRTGPLAPFGQSLSDGLKLGLAQFRSENPQLGTQVGVVVADDGGLASEAEKAAERLITQQKVHVIIGSISNIVNQSIAAVSLKNPSLLVLPRCTDEALLGKELTFCLSPSDRRQGRMMGLFALRQLRRDQAAVLLDARTPDSEMISKGFAETFAQGGGKVLGTWTLSGDRNKDAQALREIAASGAKLVVYPGSYRTVAPALKEAQAADLKATWLGGDGWDHVDLFKPEPNLGTQYYFSYFHASDPHVGVQNFVNDFQTAYGRKPDALAAYGYEAIRVVLQAYVIAHGGDQNALAKALEGAHLGAIYGAGHFTKEHNYRRPAPFMVTSSGQARFMSRVDLEE